MVETKLMFHDSLKNRSMSSNFLNRFGGSVYLVGMYDESHYA